MADQPEPSRKPTLAELMVETNRLKQELNDLLSRQEELLREGFRGPSQHEKPKS